MHVTEDLSRRLGTGEFGMVWWQVILTLLAVLLLAVGLAIWSKAAAYRRDAEEHGDFDE